MHANKHFSLLSSAKIIELLFKVKPLLAQPKSYRPDSERLVYSQLLQFATKYLQNIIADPNALQRSHLTSIQLLGTQFFNPLFEEVIALARRQCSQKATLLKIVYDFYKEAIIIAEKYCEDRIKNIISEYSINLTSKQMALTQEKQVLNNKLKAMEQQNEEKWKTFYMIVRDNRVLRRQKGKLIRVIYQQRTKISKIHNQMLEIARENQKNRLLVNYQQNQQSLPLFLKNQYSLSKLQQFMHDYPKYAKRILRYDLKQLQILQQQSLHEKVQYIIKAAKETEEIFDQYQDLVDVSKPNHILFNVSSQTQPQEEPETVQAKVAITTTEKAVQSSQKLLAIKPQEYQVRVNTKQIEVPKRRRAVFIVPQEVKKIQQANKKIKHKLLQITKRVVYIKYYDSSFKKTVTLNLDENIINLAFKFQKDFKAYPTLPIDFRLSSDIRRAKDFVYSKREKRQSRLSSITLNYEHTLQPNFIAIIESNINESNILSLRGKNQSGQDLQKQKIITVEKDQIVQLSNSDSNKVKDIVGNQKIKIRKQKIQKSIIKTEPLQEVNSKQNFQTNIEKDNRKLLKQGININRSSKKKTNLIESPSKQQILAVPQKQRLLRKSGFAINKSSGKIANTLKQQGYSTFNQSTSSRDPKISQERISLTRESIRTQDKLASTISGYGAAHQRQVRLSREHRSVNIISQQCTRLTQKLFKAINLKRNEICEGKMTLEQFLRKFMVNQYGSHLNFVLSTHVNSHSDQHNPVAEVFDILMSAYESTSYLQLIFGLFARLLSTSECATLIIEPQRGWVVKNQLSKLYLGCQIQYSQKQYQQCNNICWIFKSLQKRINQKLKNCQLYTFLHKLLPRSQSTLTYEQIKQILTIFTGQQQHLQQLMILRQNSQTEISPLLLCIHAFRQNWSHFINIQTYINNRYLNLFGQFNTQLAEKMIMKCTKLQKLCWSYNLLKDQITDPNCPIYSIQKSKYFSILFMTNQIQKTLPLSDCLNELANQWLILGIRKTCDAMIYNT